MICTKIHIYMLISAAAYDTSPPVSSLYTAAVSRPAAPCCSSNFSIFMMFPFFLPIRCARYTAFTLVHKFIRYSFFNPHTQSYAPNLILQSTFPDPFLDPAALTDDPFPDRTSFLSRIVCCPCSAFPYIVTFPSSDMFTAYIAVHLCYYYSFDRHISLPFLWPMVKSDMFCQ